MHGTSMAYIWQTDGMGVSEQSLPDPMPDPVHDLGGHPGFGPVPVDDDAIFHNDWERKAFALTQFSQRASSFNTDAFRFAIEREDPELYLTLPYFHRWIRNGERMLVEGGVIAADEIPSRIAGEQATAEAVRTTDATKPEQRGTLRQIDAPASFGPGQQVRVRDDLTPVGHTRLPGYVRGRTGHIDRLQEAWVFPDTHAHGLGEQPTWVYAVRFEASDLWPDDYLTNDDVTSENDSGSHAVFVDLFEPYLEQA